VRGGHANICMHRAQTYSLARSSLSALALLPSPSPEFQAYLRARTSLPNASLRSSRAAIPIPASPSAPASTLSSSPLPPPRSGASLSPWPPLRDANAHSTLSRPAEPTNAGAGLPSPEASHQCPSSPCRDDELADLVAAIRAESLAPRLSHLGLAALLGALRTCLSAGSVCQAPELQIAQPASQKCLPRPRHAHRLLRERAKALGTLGLLATFLWAHSTAVLKPVLAILRDFARDDCPPGRASSAGDVDTGSSSSGASECEDGVEEIGASGVAATSAVRKSAALTTAKQLIDSEEPVFRRLLEIALLSPGEADDAYESPMLWGNQPTKSPRGHRTRASVGRESVALPPASLLAAECIEALARTAAGRAALTAAGDPLLGVLWVAEVEDKLTGWSGRAGNGGGNGAVVTALLRCACNDAEDYHKVCSRSHYAATRGASHSARAESIGAGWGGHLARSSESMCAESGERAARDLPRARPDTRGWTSKSLSRVRMAHPTRAPWVPSDALMHATRELLTVRVPSSLPSS